MENKISIAIDGPAAAGKSTVAKIIAEKLSYIYVDTGAMYRALTYKAIKHDVDVNDESGLLDLLMDTEIQLLPGETGQLVYLDGEDVSEVIRTSQVTSSVSAASKHRGVRAEMVSRQQKLGEMGGVVMDGRDIGTFVLPRAEVKVFLIASVDERAERRHNENVLKGFPSDLESLKEEIALRDKLDSEREVAPLMKADDAVEIDTTSLSIAQVADEIMKLIKERTIE
ncbi:(d)CMP kinase [Peribacillus sp. SCS-37]|uniref:(d)CMP kinase n=1 Tax=Paraperibacillus esterisolvens TaxID=3115296 RepID=UPI003905EA15